ncbi:beta-ketoacyl-ACP synthase III [bacterium]|nr:beta-ketoacyl-ACP synthase III [bacterium]
MGDSSGRVTAFDINASCMSFLAALDTVGYLVAAEKYTHVLLVSADIATYGVNWDDLREGGIFGDGAAAVVVRKSTSSESSSLRHSNMKTWTEGVKHCQIRGGGTRLHPLRDRAAFESALTFEMNGKAVFKLANRYLPDFINRSLSECELTLEQIDLFVPHQASKLALEHLAKKLKVPDEKIIRIFQTFGNQVGASLPTALHYGIETQKIKRGNTIMLVGTGAGLTMGTIILTY